MNAIVSVTSDWAIGNAGRLLVRNRADMRRFVERTMGGTVVMGRVTFEGFPAGPLKGRRNVVVTRDAGYGAAHPGIEVASSPAQALEVVARDDPERVWLIGGAQLYRRMLACCATCEVTRNHVRHAADAYFPDLDQDPRWELVRVEEGGVTEEGVAFDFATYRNREVAGTV